MNSYSQESSFDGNLDSPSETTVHRPEVEGSQAADIVTGAQIGSVLAATLDQCVAEDEEVWPGFSEGQLPSSDKLDKVNFLIMQACRQANTELERLGWPALFPGSPDHNGESEDE